MHALPDDYAEAVLDAVERIPEGRVSTYGAIAGLVRERLDRGGPRQVASTLARYGGMVPWWRVCAAGGRLADRVAPEQRSRLLGEGVRIGANGRVRMDLVGWPDDAEAIEYLDGPG